ncbi:MAG: hypothetical protein MUP13_16510, partial [Thermoanaerobaculales bacterium]|nr:hypothetical protein [Thermoanaerobaculales bacterium]
MTEELTDEAIRKPFAGDPGHIKTRLSLLTDKHCLSNVETSINRSIPSVPNRKNVRSAMSESETGVEKKTGGSMRLSWSRIVGVLALCALVPFTQAGATMLMHFDLAALTD